MARKRRERGDGGLYQRKDGMWCGRVELPPEVVDGRKRRRQRFVYAKTKPEALRLLAQLQVKVATTSGTVATRADRTTVAEYLQAWLGGLEVRPRTRDQYDWIVSAYLIKHLGGVRLAALELGTLEHFFADLRRDGVGDRTRQLCYDVLRSALKRAVRARILPFNPLEEISRPRVERREVDPWSAEEASLVIEASKADRFHALYVLELRLGLQFPGEVLGLRWDQDVDLKARKLRVGGQLTGERVRGGTKTAARRRQLDLPQAVVDALTAHKQRLLEEGLRASPWVFPDGQGNAQNARNFVRDSFNKVVQRAGELRCRSCARPLEGHPADCEFVPGVRRIRPYDMRHTFATLALLGGVHIKVVSRMLGHANETETLRTYSHFLPSMLEDANDRIGAMLGDDPSSVAR